MGHLIIHGRPWAIGLDTADLGPACYLPVLRAVGGGDVAAGSQQEKPLGGKL